MKCIHVQRFFRALYDEASLLDTPGELRNRTGSSPIDGLGRVAKCFFNQEKVVFDDSVRGCESSPVRTTFVEKNLIEAEEFIEPLCTQSEC